MFFRALICASLACFTWSHPALSENVRAGYRIDATPFSFCKFDDSTECEQVADWSQKRFDGFVAAICDFIFEDNKMNPETVGVTAITRNQKMETMDVDERIDVLCDSTSVTFPRSEKYLFSPLIFVSGVSYAVSRSARESEEAAFVKFLSEDDENLLHSSTLPRVPHCYEMDAAGVAPVQRIGVLAGTTALQAVKHEQTQSLFRLNRGADRGERVCIEEVQKGGYLEGIKRLCQGDYSYFFGDRDLLLRRLEDFATRTAELDGNYANPCDAELSSAFFSFEPYAIAVRADRPDLYLKVQTSVLKFFSEPERVKALFKEKFGQQAHPSELVESLFKLNALGQVE